MAPPQRLDLRPDHHLMNPDFDGYKLSLDAVAVHKAAVAESGAGPLAVAVANEEQYSFLHAKLFGQTNLLQADRADPSRVYLLGRRGVWQVHREEAGQNRVQMSEKWAWPANVENNKKGDYNASLCLLPGDAHLAVYADGGGRLFILDTGDRSQARAWRERFREEICGPERPFVVVDAAVPESPAGQPRQLHCLLQYVEEKTKVDGLASKKTPDSVNFVNVVEWMTFSETTSSSCQWSLDRVRRYVFLGGLDYLRLAPDASRLLCATDKVFHLVFDSTGGVLDDEEDAGGDMAAEENAAAEQMVNDPETKEPLFYYMQNVEDLVVWILLPADAHKRDLKVTLRPSELKVVFRGETKLSGKLWNVVSGDSLSWTIDKGKLEITLSKATVGLIWKRLVAEGQEDGEEVIRPETVDELSQMFAQRKSKQSGGGGDAAAAGEDPPPLFNAQQLEECDALPVDDYAMYVVGGEKAAGQSLATHMAPMSGHQWLFGGAGSPSPAFCLRHDVDGLVWEPELAVGDPDAARFRHTATFFALGFVQASKTQRKYTLAAPDGSYAAICDAGRHVYVYHQPSAVNTDLRNRKSGRRVSHVSKQQVITLEDTDDILGAVATDEGLILVTGSTLSCVSIR